MNINDLTDQQLNHLAAKAQGWERKLRPYYQEGSLFEYYYFVDDADNWISEAAYDPTHNGQQAMDLVRKFEVRIRPDLGWSAAMYHRDGRSEWWTADTPERAIVLAVVASKYGVDIDEKLFD